MATVNDLLVASCHHDHHLTYWNISNLADDYEDAWHEDHCRNNDKEEEEEEEENEEEEAKRRGRGIRNIMYWMGRGRIMGVWK